MTAKIEIPNLDDLLRRYQAGESCLKLAGEAGVDPGTMRKRLRAARIFRIGHTPRHGIVVSRDVFIRYEAGESINVLSREIGVDRSTIRRRLLQAGIVPRTQSESEFIKWSRMTNEQRAAQVAAAHSAATGRKCTWEELCARAIIKESSGIYIVPAETELANQLRQAGFEIRQQRAVGP